MKRFLITTALEESWLYDQPVLFLGEWCLLHSRKDRWSKMNAEVLPYHWADREKLHADYLYLRDLYERVLGDLAIRLNRIHGENHELRYWRILVGPWLAYFMQMLYDRWLSIQEALNRFDITGTVILTGNDDEFVPNDMAHFADLMVGDEWNHHIYAAILEDFGNVSCVRRAGEKKSQIALKRNGNIGIKKKIAAIFVASSSLFVRDRDAFLISTYFPFLDEMRLHLRLGEVPQRWSSVQSVHVNVEWRRRKWEMADQGQSHFEKFILKMIPKQIPTLYLEGYQYLVQQARGGAWPRHPKVIYSSNMLWHDTVSMAYTAEKVEQGTPLVYGQHGGLYGMARFMWSEEHEREVADKYLTWGWTENSRAETVATGLNTKICKRGNSSKKAPTDLLLVLGPDGPRYTYRLDSDSGLNRLAKGISDCLQFGYSLSASDAYNALLVRLFRQEYGLGVKDQWMSVHPSVRLDQGIKPIWELVGDAKLIVYTYNSTGYLEFMAADVPVIMFWDVKLSQLRDSAIPYFEDLKRVGIFHETPESAAAHVNKVWDDVDAWWTGAEVQEVLVRFKKQYAYRPDNLLDRVASVLRDAIAESEIRITLADTRE